MSAADAGRAKSSVGEIQFHTLEKSKTTVGNFRFLTEPCQYLLNAESSPAPPADMRAVTATTWSTLGDARSKRGLCSTGSAPVESYTTPFAVFVTAESWYGRHFASSSPPCHCITASPSAKTANEKDADAARYAAIRASARPVLP